jgi:hypothetical protein
MTTRVVRNRRLCHAGYLWGAVPARSLTRSPRPLRPTPRARGHLPRCRPPPCQPILRDLVPLPSKAHQLRRSHGLPTRHQIAT